MYSRLDYILIEHSALEVVMETSIDIATISDHAPVTMNLKLKRETPGRGAWRINEDIIEDQEVERIIETEIYQYFLTHDTPEVSKAIIWEVYKVVIRGQLIAIGARKKKERETNM